jgi:hyperosmotically inducible protein
MKLFLMAAAFITLAVTAADAQNIVTRNRPANLKGVEDQVYRRILMLPNYGLYDSITAQVNGSTVILGGHTLSLGTKKEAERVVKRVPGVTNVVNNISELSLSPFDDQIRRQLTFQIARTGGLARYLDGVNPPVRLIVDRGRISLEGYVDNRADANTMNIIAQGVSGAFSVENHLIVKSDRLR